LPLLAEIRLARAAACVPNVATLLAGRIAA
jgi:hypothetical protein